MTFAATILSTKILKPGLANKALAYGVEIIERKFIQTEPVPFSYNKKDDADCFVFTSSNAVKIIHDSGIQLSSKRIACLSGETKKLLSDKAIAVDFEATDAKALAQKLIEAKIKSVVFFCGNIHRDELPETLKEAGINIKEVVVYRTQLTPVAVTDFIDAILFFSPSAVDSFLINNTISTNTICFCIGQTTANHLASKTKAIIKIASGPSQEKLIDQAINYFTNEVHAKE